MLGLVAINVSHSATAIATEGRETVSVFEELQIL